MARKDRIEDELAWLRITYALVVATDVSLIGWIALSIYHVPDLLVAFAAVAAAGLQVSLVAIARATVKRHNRLENE